MGYGANFANTVPGPITHDALAAARVQHARDVTPPKNRMTRPRVQSGRLTPFYCQRCCILFMSRETLIAECPTGECGQLWFAHNAQGQQMGAELNQILR